MKIRVLFGLFLAMVLFFKVLLSSCAGAEQKPAGCSLFTDRAFAIGTLETPEIGKSLSKDQVIPRFEGVDTYDCIIRDHEGLDDYSELASTRFSKQPNEDFARAVGKRWFFTGYIKMYPYEMLEKENPRIEWLQHPGIGAVHEYQVFDIERMLPVEDSNALTIDAPQDVDMGGELTINVSVRNLLPVPIVDAYVVIYSKRGWIDEKEFTDSPFIDGLKFAVGEVKKFEFKFKPNYAWGEPVQKDAEFLAKFAGYGSSDNPIRPEKVVPIFSVKGIKYRLEWKKSGQ